MSYQRNNVHAYASNYLPSEENLISYLNQHFEIFENNFKNGNIAALNNTQLPRVIVEKFKRLHELWDGNRVRDRYVENKLIDDVYSSISHTFGNNLGKSTAFEKRYSRLYDEFAKMAEPSRKRPKNASVVYGPCSTEDPRNRKLFIGKFNKNCLEVCNLIIRCALCDTQLKSISTFVSHMNGAPHEEAIDRFGWNRKYVKEIDQQTLQCSLCNIRFARLCLFLDHCKEVEHQNQLQKFEDTSEERDFFKDLMFIDVTKFNFQCPICQCTTSGIYQLFGHLRSRHELEITREEKYEDAKYLEDDDGESYDDDEDESSSDEYSSSE